MWHRELRQWAPQTANPCAASHGLPPGNDGVMGAVNRQAPLSCGPQHVSRRSPVGGEAFLVGGVRGVGRRLAPQKEWGRSSDPRRTTGSCRVWGHLGTFCLQCAQGLLRLLSEMGGQG